MKKQLKSIPGKELMTNSKIFMQLGFIWALLLVYSLFEMNFERDVPILSEISNLNNEPDAFVIPIVQIEKKVEPVEKSKPEKLEKPVILDKIDVIDDDKIIETVLIQKTEKEPKIDFNQIFSDVPDIESDDEAVPFMIVEKAPRFPGCKEASEEELRKCLNESIRKYVGKRMNTNVNLNLEGKQRIMVLFEIDRNGKVVNIQAKAPHEKLKKEAIKAVSKLPQMQPAMQRNQTVGVKYSLPITVYMN